MKNFVIACAYANWDDEWEVEQLTHSYNEVITENKPQQSTAIEIDKNFLSLCSLMEENGSSKPSE